jgi:hypothetical protein
MSQDITIVVPACNRSALLASTLRRLLPHVLRYEIPVLIGENCIFSDELQASVAAISAEVPAADIELIDLTRIGSFAGSKRMLRVVDHLYGMVTTPYIFHCEEDWWLSDADFMAPSKAILEQFPEVTIVRLTGEEVRPFPDKGSKRTVHYGNDATADFFYSNYGGAGGAYGAFTFHPGLRRRSDYLDSLGPYERFEHEASISKHAQTLGHREAVLDGTFARHAGRDQSAMRSCLSRARRAPLTGVDTDHPAVYHVYNACLQLGQKPTLHFFTPGGNVPEAIAQDRATNVWLGYAGHPRNEWPLLQPRAQRLWEEVDEAVYYFHDLENPAHSLHDVIFSVALQALAPEERVPYFSHFVDSGAQPEISADARWGLFVHRACGLLDAAGALVRDREEAELFCFRHLVVPKFMRHRFAHDWSSGPNGPGFEYIDRTRDYPQWVLDRLRERLFSACFGDEVAPWDNVPPVQYRKLVLYDRQGAGRRRWSNGAEAFHWLESRYGNHFSSMVHVSDEYQLLSPREQAALFHSADVVIAPHGGALANLIFCRPGTRIIELTDEPGTPGWCTFTRRLGMAHFPFRPTSLREHYPKAFELPIEEFDELVRASLLAL